ncbi:MAG TPA: kynureninase [Spartobacteria bacterium]|jgi:kynureninase|nr:kynureninase [Spartobacteria bacterium]HCP90435.1 kynureninase [Spartobacteria bacterium]
MTFRFSADEKFALQLDAEDPLRQFRERFHLPLGKDGKPLIYLAGNSLGLMPKAARKIVEQELDDWAKLAVDAHLKAPTPWYSYHETLREPTARLVGAKPNEVICMNSLTVNLHLMMATFYRPTKSRFKILMEEPAFPSDTYAIKTQIVHHGFDPNDALVLARPREGEFTVRQDDIETALEKHGDQIALVLFAGVNFFTGQLFDIERITAAAQKRGCAVGVDLAHAAGNVPLALHDWNVDFAVWCSYKYLNAGPGAVAGAFVHERHATNRELPRLAGWFGNDPATRFRLHLEPEFIPVPSADGWQISNPPIFSMAPLRSSLSIFDEAGGMKVLRAKSIKLTGYLQFLLEQTGSKRYAVVTPREADARGCQLSILVHEHPKELFDKLAAAGVKCDFREPNVIRAAPTPLFNTFHEVWRFAKILAEHQ